MVMRVCIRLGRHLIVQCLLLRIQDFSIFLYALGTLPVECALNCKTLFPAHEL